MVELYKRVGASNPEALEGLRWMLEAKRMYEEAIDTVAADLPPLGQLLFLLGSGGSKHPGSAA
jgi:hypothetical protein